MHPALQPIPQRPNNIHRRNIQRPTERNENAQRWLPFLTFNKRNVTALYSCTASQFQLGKSSLKPQLPQQSAKRFHHLLLIYLSHGSEDYGAEVRLSSFNSHIFEMQAFMQSE